MDGERQDSWFGMRPPGTPDETPYVFMDAIMVAGSEHQSPALLSAANADVPDDRHGKAS